MILEEAQRQKGALCTLVENTWQDSAGVSFLVAWKQFLCINSFLLEKFVFVFICFLCGINQFSSAQLLCVLHFLSDRKF